MLSGRFAVSVHQRGVMSPTLCTPSRFLGYPWLHSVARWASGPANGSAPAHKFFKPTGKPKSDTLPTEPTTKPLESVSKEGGQSSIEGPARPFRPLVPSFRDKGLPNSAPPKYTPRPAPPLIKIPSLGASYNIKKPDGGRKPSESPVAPKMSSSTSVPLIRPLVTPKPPLPGSRQGALAGDRTKKGGNVGQNTPNTPSASLFPSLAEPSEFTRMKEQFAKIRAEREALAAAEAAKAVQNKGVPGTVNRPASTSPSLSGFSLPQGGGEGGSAALTQRIANIRRANASRAKTAARGRGGTTPAHTAADNLKHTKQRQQRPAHGAPRPGMPAVPGKHKFKSRKNKQQHVVAGKDVELNEGITPRQLAERMSVKLRYVSDVLADLGEEAVDPDKSMDVDVAEVIVTEAGQIPRRTDKRRANRIRTEPMTQEEADAKGVVLKPRNPIFTLLGHVDHGKTTLLDTLRGSNVAAKEVGGITQCVAGFTTKFDKTPVTFLDTPGHVLFQSMRERGASAADVAVLVVAADDGVMPQTLAAVKIILEFSLPCVVAVTKADTHPDPESRKAAISQQLLEAGLVTEEFGGDAPVVVISAKSGFGMPAFKEALLLQAEMLEPKAAFSVPGEAVVVESTTVKGLGNVADCVVRWGTLKQGDYFVVGNTYGKVKALLDSSGGRIKEAGASTPVRVTGLSDFPKAGEDLLVVPSEDVAKGVIEGRKRRQEFQSMLRNESSMREKREEAKQARAEEKEHERRVQLAQFRDRLRRRKVADGLPIPDDLKEQPWERRIAAGEDAFTVRQRLLKEAQAVDATKSFIHLMVHADTQGSVDAIQDILHRLPPEDLNIKIVRTSVGDISPTDVDMAVMSKSIVIAFNVKVTTPLAKILSNANLTTLSANNVYGLVDMLTATLSQFMPSVTEEEVLGTAEVKQFFPGPRDFDGMVAGAIVTSGEFTRTANFRLVRNGKTIFECEGLPSMRRFSDEVNKVGKGLEFGASVPFADTRQGDKMVSFVTKQQRKPLEIKL